jgi:hypothetical protein
MDRWMDLCYLTTMYKVPLLFNVEGYERGFPVGELETITQGGIVSPFIFVPHLDA